MNYKKTAEDLLRAFHDMERSERNILDQIEASELKMQAARISSQNAVGGRRNGGSSYDDTLADHILKKELLSLELSSTRKLLTAIRRGLAALPDDERAALTAFYIERTPGYIDDLCDTLCCERSTVYRVKDIALQHFTVSMYGSGGVTV